MTAVQQLQDELAHLSLYVNSPFVRNSLKLKDFHKFDSASTGMLRILMVAAFD